MGKASRIKRERGAALASVPQETHEPAVPQDWPNGHVGVALTDADQGECIEITIHGVRHYLHSTTARELSNMLLDRLEEWNVKAQAAGALGA